MSKLTPFTSVLVANRGEIALRIMETMRREGLRPVAVYTQADRDAPHVGFADQAVCIGSGPVADSYLSIGKMIDAARKSGAEAVHPGYGFLSERAEFAQACVDAGLVFIGPPASAIELMGNKAKAKREMIAAGVPCVPGYEGEDQATEVLAGEADRLGYPVMIKAAAGGGGRGMRLVEKPARFSEALKLARSEALGAFGSDEVILEKAIIRPRHVEIQVLADRHGTVLHLGERDCSVQRRHQKVVEEAPCPVLSPELREAMGRAAVEAARSIGYEGAGTVEFLLDQAGAFYFLEMNTRLQVEHPVTELVTGRDLVALQLAVARGDPLGFAQDDVALNGHAIEVRLYAEDPAKGFLPCTGRIDHLRWPRGNGVRVDAGVVAGQVVSPFYDPMLAKIIAQGATRQEAINRLITALADTVVFGPVTNRDFLLAILRNEKFARGEATTAFLAENFDAAGFGSNPPGKQEIALAAVLLYRQRMEEAQRLSVVSSAKLQGWGGPGFLVSRFELVHGAERHGVRIRTRRDGVLDVVLGSTRIEGRLDGDHVYLNGKRAGLTGWALIADRLWLATSRAVYCFGTGTAAASGSAGATGNLTAPMHGTIAAIDVAVGDAVTPLSRLLVLEAMKMQHEMFAPVVGIITAIHGAAGEQVAAGRVLVEIEPGEKQ